MELIITKEKVLEAAEKCSTAKATLQVLFPEAFEKEVGEIKPFEISLNTDKGIFIGDGYSPLGFEKKCVLVDMELWEQINDYKGHKVFIQKPVK
jgi:hypothetical protein